MRYFFPGYDEHLSDEHLMALFCHRSSVTSGWITRRHLSMCSCCRERRERLEVQRTERMLQLYRDGMESADPVPPDASRVVFTHWLDTQMSHESMSARRPSHSPKRTSLWLPVPRYVMSGGVVLCLVAGALFFGYRRWQRVPDLSPDALLTRAERWNASSSGVRFGVIHQTVRIKTAKQSVDRSLYLDLQGKRQPRHAALVGAEEELRTELKHAGINWDQPLSASDYHAWHDSKHERFDRIVRSSSHLLTLTTTVPEGPVAQESLTVRDSDFHPLRRTVDFRDNGETIEVAEVNFAVLPWSAVNANAFEPLDGSASIPVAGLLPAMPSLQDSGGDVLDETELAARLILDKLHADTGEQIEVRRSAHLVEVEGLVDTEKRQRMLTAELTMVPQLKVSIQSLDHLSDHSFSGNQTIRVEDASLPDQASALDTYLRAHGRSVAESSILARRLSDCALSISRESGAIAYLSTRFSAPENLSLIASGTLGSLLYSHHERLEAALVEQRSLLMQVEGRRAAHHAAGSHADVPLVEAANRNLSLSRELTQTAKPPVRSAEGILADISVAMETIVAAAYPQDGRPAHDLARNPER